MIKSVAFCQDYIAHWSVDDEYYIKGYEVEQSDDSLEFKSIALIAATHEPNHEYKFKLPAVTAWYRLKVLSDPDFFTKTISVTADVIVTLLPGSIQINSPKTMQTIIALFDVTGRFINKKSVLVLKGQNEFEYSTPVARGVYILRVASTDMLVTKKIVTQ